MFKDLHIVGWPLLAGILAEATGLRARLAATLAPARLAWIRRAGLVVLQACAIAILVYVAVAFVRPAYTEWVESGVASIAKLWAAGGAIYPDTAAPGKYTVFPYGPLLFQFAGGIYALSDGSDKAVRAAYVCLALATYVLMLATVLRQRVGLWQGAVSVEILAVVVGIMGFMVKADIMLVFIAACACALVAFERRQIWVGAGLAVLAGAAVAIKIHGVFYILPAAIQFLAMQPRHIALKILAAGVVAAGVAFAPFLVSGTSLANYVFILRTASHDGLLFGIFLSNVAFICMCVAGVHILTPQQNRDASYDLLMLSLLAAGLFVSVFAAKSEAGPHHLIPLLPYLCLPLARALRGQMDVRRAVLFVLFLVSFQPITSVAGDIVKMLAHWGTPAALI